MTRINKCLLTMLMMSVVISTVIQNNKEMCHTRHISFVIFRLFTRNQNGAVSVPEISANKLLARLEAPIRKYSLVNHFSPSTSLTIV